MPLMSSPGWRELRDSVEFQQQEMGTTSAESAPAAHKSGPSIPQRTACHAASGQAGERARSGGGFARWCERAAGEDLGGAEEPDVSFHVPLYTLYF